MTRSHNQFQEPLHLHVQSNFLFPQIRSVSILFYLSPTHITSRPSRERTRCQNSQHWNRRQIRILVSVMEDQQAGVTSIKRYEAWERVLERLTARYLQIGCSWMVRGVAEYLIDVFFFAPFQHLCIDNTNESYDDHDIYSILQWFKGETLSHRVTHSMKRLKKPST